jgi:hypothetical protein
MVGEKQADGKSVGHGKYEIGRAYYKMSLASEWDVPSPPETPKQPLPGVVIETWFYQGYFKLDWNTTACDVPHHFHVFQPFVPRENALERPPEQGLKIPSLRGAELSMLTFDELLSELADNQRGQDSLHGLGDFSVCE